MPVLNAAQDFAELPAHRGDVFVGVRKQIADVEAALAGGKKALDDELEIILLVVLDFPRGCR